MASSAFPGATGASVTVTLENVGARTLRWSTYGCETILSVGARMGSVWAEGAEHPRPFGSFKEMVLEEYQGATGVIALLTSSSPFHDLEGLACPDVVLAHHLEPGERVQAMVQVAGRAFGPNGPAPAGPVVLFANLHDWYRGPLQTGFIDPPSIEVELSAELRDGRSVALLSASQAIDVALGDATVQDILIRNPMLRDYEPFSIAYDELTLQWRLVLTDTQSNAGAHAVTIVIDAMGARVLEVRRAG